MKYKITLFVSILFPLYIFAGISSAESADGSLPVELTSFSAEINSNFVLLTWVTATEVNNYGFDVQRNTSLSSLSRGKLEGRDVWKTIGFVEGHGNSYSPKAYSYVDSSNLSGEIYYRLKQIDTDGTFEYSDIATINLSFTSIESSNKIKNSLFQNHPNPFNPSTIISYYLDKAVNVSLKVYDILGNEIASLVDGEKQNAGIHSVEFNKFSSSKNLSSGIYFYQIIAGQYVKTKKMLLLK